MANRAEIQKKASELPSNAVYIRRLSVWVSQVLDADKVCLRVALRISLQGIRQQFNQFRPILVQSDKNRRRLYDSARSHSRSVSAVASQLVEPRWLSAEPSLSQDATFSVFKAKLVA